MEFESLFQNDTKDRWVGIMRPLSLSVVHLVVGRYIKHKIKIEEKYGLIFMHHNIQSNHNIV